MADTAATVIGGGVVGLAIAAELAPRFSPLVLLERNPKYGQETSSRNSEVIHAGIYYPAGSLKALLCVEGRELLYRLCEAEDIPHCRITKIITSVRPEELGELEGIYRCGTENGAPLEFWGAARVRALEPNIVTYGGIFSPQTGIISAHGLMDYLAHAATRHGATLQMNCRVTGVARTVGGYQIEIAEGNQTSTFTTEIVVNAAGLEADVIAGLAGIDIDVAGYRLTYSKGCYFAVPPSHRTLVSRLIYPVPTKDSLGVHVVLDLGGGLKFGPDVEYLGDRSLDYRVDEGKRGAFAASARRILPGLRDEDFTPDMCGIRPRLQGPNDPFRDFVIREESERGLPGFVNLIGIESPGLTASPAIARYVAWLLR
jgi:L-2-hydroxyglutarate oxidase LhgO